MTLSVDWKERRGTGRHNGVAHEDPKKVRHLPLARRSSSLSRQHQHQCHPFFNRQDQWSTAAEPGVAW